MPSQSQRQCEQTGPWKLRWHRVSEDVEEHENKYGDEDADMDEDESIY